MLLTDEGWEHQEAHKPKGGIAMTKRAIIYARVSTDSQRENYSIPTQLSVCRKYGQQHGYAFVGDSFVDPITGLDTTERPDAVPAYVDDYTSRELSRPGLNRALAFLEKVGGDVMLVLAVDRLARDPDRKSVG